MVSNEVIAKSRSPLNPTPQGTSGTPMHRPQGDFNPDSGSPPAGDLGGGEY